MGCSPSKSSTFGTPETTTAKRFSAIPVETTESDAHIQVSILLSPEQKESIRRSWEVLEKNKEVLGKQIFLKIFEEKPQLKDLFSFRCVWGDSLINHPDIKAHAMKFMTILQEGVKNLDYLDRDFTPKLLALGGRHTKFEGFEVSNFPLFETAILFILKREIKEKFVGATEKSWIMFLRYIMKNLREGYNQKQQIILAVDNGSFIEHADIC